MTKETVMPFHLPKLADFYVNKGCINIDADKLDAKASRKERIAIAARNAIEIELTHRIRAAIENALLTHYAIEGEPSEYATDAEWLSNLNVVLRDAFKLIPDAIVAEHLLGAALWEAGRTEAAASAMAEAFMPEYEPKAGDESGYLTALGIPATDYKGAMPAVEDRKFGPHPALRVATANTRYVTIEEISKAYKLFRAATALDVNAIAYASGVSRPTMGNYLSGRSSPQHINRKQAQVMRVDIERRMADLMEAATIFSRVLS